MKKSRPEKDNSERYLISYADLMNLLLILFIILYSMSKTDVAKATAVAESIRKGFNASVSTSQANQSPNSANTTSTAVSTGNDYSVFYDQLMNLIKQAGMENQVSVVADSSDVIITLKDTALYESGSATMNPTAKNMMFSVGQLLNQVQYAMVFVDGYTDSDPISTTQFQDNLDLSTARANGVNRVLQSAGVPANKVQSVGHGEQDPVASNDTVEHKAMNRRVVLTIFKSMNGLTAQQYLTAKELLGLQSQAAAANSSSIASSSASSKATSGKTSSSKATSSKTASSKTTSSSKATSSKK